MSLPPRLRRSFFDRPVLKVAAELIGATLMFRGVGGDHRGGRGLSPYRSGRAYLQRADRPQCGDVWAAGLCLCVSVLRHPLVRECRLRGRRFGQRRPDPRARADPRHRGDAAAARPEGRAASLLRPGPVMRGARHHARRRTAWRSTGRPSNCGRVPEKPDIVEGRADRDHQGRRPALAFRRQRLALSRASRSRADTLTRQPNKRTRNAASQISAARSSENITPADPQSFTIPIWG